MKVYNTGGAVSRLPSLQQIDKLSHSQDKALDDAEDFTHHTTNYCQLTNAYPLGMSF
jgi:hypothetical protein